MASSPVGGCFSTGRARRRAPRIHLGFAAADAALEQLSAARSTPVRGRLHDSGAGATGSNGVDASRFTERGGARSSCSMRSRSVPEELQLAQLGGGAAVGGQDAQAVAGVRDAAGDVIA